MKLVKKAKRGFTLVELVVVIAVIAILAAVSVGAYFGVTESANNSRLEQETKQLHTAIQQVSVGTKQNQSLGNDGLTVSNLIAFESDLKAATGQELKVTNDDVTNVYVPTIRLSTDEYRKPQNSGSKYLTFEYYNPEISGKKAVANVITGDCHIAESTATNNPNSNIKTFFYIDREWWRGDNLTTKVYACNEDGTKTNGSWPGVEPTFVEKLRYEEETLYVYSYDVDLDVYTKMVWTSSAANATNHTYQTNDILFSSMGEDNLVINNFEEAIPQFTPVYGIYEPGKVDYGQFPEKNNQTFYFMDQSWWNANNAVTKVYLFGPETGSPSDWTQYFKEVALVKSFETDGHGTSNVYSITFDINTYDHMIFVRGDENNPAKSQTIDIPVAEFTDGKNMAFLLEQTVVEGGNQKCEVYYDTYDENRWDYGQYVIIEKNFTYHFLDQYWWRGTNETNKVFVYAFNSSNNKFKTEWPGDQITTTPTSINGTYGILNSYAFTIDLNKYDKVVISSVVINEETKTVSFQTVDIQLDETNNMFALNDSLEENKYTVVKAVKENAKWDYGQVMRDLPEAEPEMKTFYFNATSEWFKEGASISCITKKDGNTLNGNFGEIMTAEDYFNSIFKITIDVNNVDKIAFMRTNFEGNKEWGGITKDIEVSTLQYNYITFKANTNLWSKASEIECKSDYVESNEELSIYLIGSFNGWKVNDENYKFNYNSESDAYTLEKNLPAGITYKVFSNNTYYSSLGEKNMEISEDGKYLFVADDSGISVDKIGEMESSDGIEQNTIYFINNDGWNTINIWAWTSSKNYTGGTWPGVAMSLVEGTRNVYYFNIGTETPTGLKVIFSNGSKQTADLSFDPSKPVYDGKSWTQTY